MVKKTESPERVERIARLIEIRIDWTGPVRENLIEVASIVIADILETSAVTEFDTLRSLIREQADNDGLWFVAETITEDYLQRHLRKLHAVCEELFRAPH